MADKDNESAPGVVCCNLGSSSVQTLFVVAKHLGLTIQEAATFALKEKLTEYAVFGVEVEHD